MKRPKSLTWGDPRTDELLVEFQASLHDSSGKRRDSLVSGVGAMWEYLVKTPGEQRPYVEFGKMLGVNEKSAFSRLKTLARNGVLEKTAGGKGSRGAGFICRWLERHRNGVIARPGAAGCAPPTHCVRDELSDIDSLAERGIQSMRLLMSQDSRVGAAMIETLREIQSGVSRAMTRLASK